MSILNVHHIARGSKIYGPGSRDVVWFKGCKIRCKGCINPHLWSFDKENEMTLEELLDNIESNEVTLLGGEPLDQENLFELILKLKLKNIGIILFTGYSYKELKDHQLSTAKLCDVVISEPFDLDKKDDRLYLRGSSNQIITFNSNRYPKELFYERSEYELVHSHKLEFRGRKKTDFLIDLLK